MNNLQVELINFNEVDKIKEIENSQNVNIISKNNIISDLESDIVKYYAIKLGKRIIGYIAFEKVLENIDIHSIVIDKNHENRGYGTFLLYFVIEFAKKNNVSNIFLDVRKSNTKAINLYKKLGFKYINTRKNYYTDTHEDALIYVKYV